MNIIILINCLTGLFLLACIVMVCILMARRMLYYKSGIFFLVCIFICLVVTVGNILEHSGIYAGLDAIEEYLEILIIPYFLLFLYSVSSRKELKTLKHKEQELKNSLEEKAVLLKEIHHRVKNNLQIVSSLIMLQSEQIEEKKTKDYLTELYNRIQSMAILHMQLYESETLSRINLGNYINAVIRQIEASYLQDTQCIIMKTIKEINITIDIAVPYGLLVNEIITNSIKHAFNFQESGQKNRIKITVAPSDKQHFLTVISDNGSGIDTSRNSGHKGLGMILIDSLIKQINGEFTVHTENGTRYEIIIPQEL